MNILNRYTFPCFNAGRQVANSQINLDNEKEEHQTNHPCITEIPYFFLPMWNHILLGSAR